MEVGFHRQINFYRQFQSEEAGSWLPMSTRVFRVPNNQRKTLLLDFPKLRRLLELKEARDGLTPTLRTESTLKVYIRQLATIFSILHPNSQFHDDESLDWIKEHERVIKAIESLTDTNGVALKPLTKGCYAAPFSILAQKQGFNEAQKAYSDYIEARKLSENELDQTAQKKTEKEIQKWVPWNDIVKVRVNLDRIISRTIVDKYEHGRALTRNDKQLVNDHLILSLYTMPLGPVRNEFGSCRILMQEEVSDFEPKPGDMNSCILDTDPKRCEFIISTHKTLSKVGIRRLQIPEFLVKVILRTWNLCPRKFLVMKSFYLGFKDEPISNFTPVLNDLGERHFGKKLLVRFCVIFLTANIHLN
jgi:hypothetical protein